MPDFNPALDEQLQRLEERADSLRRHLPPEEPRPATAPPPQPLLASCPACGAAMEAGKVSVHGTLLGFLFVGMSYQHCWFRPAASEDEQVVVQSGRSRRACRCSSCGFIGIEPQRK